MYFFEDDAGGVRGFAQIEIVAAIMDSVLEYEVQSAGLNGTTLTEEEKDEIMRPCNRFVRGKAALDRK